MAIPQGEQLLKVIDMSRTRFLYGLDRTPDDRLDWSPGGSATTPLQIAGKTVRLLSVLAELIQNRTMPERPASPPPPPQSREEAKAALDAAFERMRTVIAELSETDLEQTVPTPWGVMTPTAQALWFINGAIGYCQGQLNYVQTAYGDTDPNMPPGWGQEG